MLSLYLLLSLTLLYFSWAQPPPIINLGQLQLHICHDQIIRITYDASISQNITYQPSLVVKEDWNGGNTNYKTQQNTTTFILTTSSTEVIVDLNTFAVSFRDLISNNIYLNEISKGGKTFTQVNDLGKTSYAIQQEWESPVDEVLYGLGEFQNGLVGFPRGTPLNLIQFNTEAPIPFFLSTRGYGILWDSYARTQLNPFFTTEISNSSDVEIPLTASLDTNKPDTIADGTLLSAIPCQDNYWGQQWSYQAYTQDYGSLLVQTKNQPNSSLDCNGCQSSSLMHMWSQDPNNGNQWWTLTSDQFIKSTEVPTNCLTLNGNSVGMATCDSKNVNQKWIFNTTSGQISNEGICLSIITAMKGDFRSQEQGLYQFYVEMTADSGSSFGASGSVIITLASGTQNYTIISWDGLSSMPSTLSTRVTLPAQTAFSVAVTGGSPFHLYARRPSYSSIVLRSDYGQRLDYYFFAGSSVNTPSLDATIALYRLATGSAPLYPRWVYGFWQCKERYHNQTELLQSAQGFRDRNLPVDNIVQDWYYWGSLGWGPQWDPSLYPDPAGMVQQLKKLNFHLMVSVWSKFDTNTFFYQTLKSQNELIQDDIYMDPYNPATRAQFYAFAQESMFDIGVDALWLDATEPEWFPNHNKPVYLGSGNEYFNPYSLMVTTAVHDGLQQFYPNRRIFSLTRSSFTGQQRTGGSLWSGDISGAWDSLRRQVAASIQYQTTGIPYWSQDIGGFFRPQDQYTSDDYHDLLTRWFQFGCFTPIFRVHGDESNTEYWNYGPDVLANVLDIDNLRYRLLPYIYSLAYQVEINSYTLQRALIFDFATDSNVRLIADEYMFGSFLVSPITSRVTQRDVYFPRNANWTNFWDGTSIQGGSTSSVLAPINQIPLFIRQGSIIIFGPYLNYTNEKITDPLEIRIYSGLNATFNWYEDDGETKDYLNKNYFAIIKLEWDDRNKIFTIGERQGNFPGLVVNRTIHVVLVSSGHGVGIAPESKPNAVFTYIGLPTKISLT